MTKIIDVVDVIGEGSDRAGSPEVAQHPHHHFPYRANGVDEPPVAD
jgi:hypothetical protein